MVTGKREAQMHFFLHCEKFSSVRDFKYGERAKKITHFPKLTPEEKLSVLLDEGTQQLNMYLPTLMIPDEQRSLLTYFWGIINTSVARVVARVAAPTTTAYACGDVR